MVVITVKAGTVAEGAGARKRLKDKLAAVALVVKRRPGSGGERATRRQSICNAASLETTAGVQSCQRSDS